MSETAELINDTDKSPPMFSSRSDSEAVQTTSLGWNLEGKRLVAKCYYLV